MKYNSPGMTVTNSQLENPRNQERRLQLGLSMEFWYEPNVSFDQASFCCVCDRGGYDSLERLERPGSQ